MAIRDFLNKHLKLLQSEQLNHYPSDLPSPYDTWSKELWELPIEKLIRIEVDLDGTSLSSEIQSYLEEIKELSKIEGIDFKDQALDSNLERGMSAKKRHEIKAIISWLKNKEYKNFLDIGSGKGHLSMAILNTMEASSTCVDMDGSLQKAGKKKLKEYLPNLVDKIRYKNLMFTHSSKINTSENCLVLGLHSCGDLSVDAIDFHINNNGDLLNFGCCYHKLTKQNLSKLSKKNPIEFSFHALNLATRSNRQLSDEDFRRRERVKKYRYALHMILHDQLGEGFTTLGNAHYTDYDLSFSEYCAKYSPKKLNGNLEEVYFKILNDSRFKNYLYSEALRAPLGRLAELYILLDRAIYLMEAGKIIELKFFFRSSLSPRNIGIYSREY